MKTLYSSPLLKALLLVILVATIGCEPEEAVTPAVPSSDTTATAPTPTVEAVIRAEDVDFTVEYDPALEQTVYPSLILGLANRFAKEEESFGFFAYNLINPKEEAEVLITLSSSLLNEETVLRETIRGEGEAFQWLPTINWDYAALKTLRQAGNVNLTFSCSIDGKEIDSQTLRLSYRSVNECVYGYADSQGYHDLSYMFAAYVNEDHLGVDPFLQKALATGITNSFKGYQGNGESVGQQLWAIWYVLQQNGVKYSSITETSNTAQQVATQHVRFFDEVFGNQQANCVDGSVFLSSILKKIGINSFLVLEPGHMYLGIYADAEKTEPYVIETTMVGEVDLREVHQLDGVTYGLEKYLHNGYLPQYTYDAYQEGFITLEEVRQEISFNSLALAFEARSEDFNNHAEKFDDATNHDYQILDIELLRQVVQPIR